MCLYSVTAQNSRDARQGEDLVVTRAPHGGSNWLTEACKPHVAVCVPNTAVLGVQLPDESTRGASFEQARVPDERGNRDFLVYLDGEKERVALSSLPLMTKARAPSLRKLVAASGGAKGPGSRTQRRRTDWRDHRRHTPTRSNELVIQPIELTVG
jgi:hypothetical protein